MKPKTELLQFTRSLPGSRSKKNNKYIPYIVMRNYLESHYKKCGFWSVLAYKIKDNIFVLGSEIDSFCIASFINGENKILQSKIMYMKDLLFNIRKYQCE